jgi:predicted Zn-dependent peptidase
VNSNYKKILLKNGTRVVLVPDPGKEVVTTMIVFGVGSRYESEEEAGISHVLEHMHYKGTKKRPTPLKVAEFIEEIGGEHNAFTSKEYTGYYTKVASKHLDKSLDFLGDLIINPLFESEELEREKGVILQELDMYEDLPMEVAANKFEQTIFGNNALGRDVIGYKNSIKSITREKLIEFKNRHYVASNAVVVLAGNLSSYSDKRILNLLEKHFILPAGDAPKYLDQNLNNQKSFSITERKIEQSHLIIGFRGISYSDPDRYPLRMLALILGGGMSSRMFVEIREKRGLAYAVRSSITNYLDTGAFETYAGVAHARAEEAIKAILGEFRKIKNGVTAKELARAKEYVYGHLLINLEDSNEVANHYALSLLLSNEIKTPNDVVKEYEKITKEKILEVANKYIKDENMTIAFVGKGLTESKLLKEFKL